MSQAMEPTPSVDTSKLTPLQRTFIALEQAQSRVAALEGAAREPIAIIDFETLAPAVPLWQGCRPYDPVPAQFSAHVQDGRDKWTHHAWLADSPGDPRPALDSPSRAVLVSRLQELHRVPRASAPVLRGRRLFFTENDGTRNQAVLYALEGGASTGEPGTRRIV